MDEQIRDLRKRIDHIDDQLLMLLNSRMALYGDLAAHTAEESIMAQYDKDTISRLKKINPSTQVDDETIVNIWNCIFTESRRAQAE